MTNSFVIAELSLNSFKLLIDRNLLYVYIMQSRAEISALAIKELACLDYQEYSYATLSRN